MHRGICDVRRQSVIQGGSGCGIPSCQSWRRTFDRQAFDNYCKSRPCARHPHVAGGRSAALPSQFTLVSRCQLKPFNATALTERTGKATPTLRSLSPEQPKTSPAHSQIRLPPSSQRTFCTSLSPPPSRGLVVPTRRATLKPPAYRSRSLLPSAEPRAAFRSPTRVWALVLASLSFGMAGIQMGNCGASTLRPWS